MIVRDIELVDAVADLVDNCVDGARRLRPNGSYKSFMRHWKSQTSNFGLRTTAAE